MKARHASNSCGYRAHRAAGGILAPREFTGLNGVETRDYLPGAILHNSNIMPSGTNVTTSTFSTSGVLRRVTEFDKHGLSNPRRPGGSEGSSRKI